MANLTNQEYYRYVTQNNGNRSCPSCKATATYAINPGNHVKRDSIAIHQRWVCATCKSKWTERYIFTNIQDIEDNCGIKVKDLEVGTYFYMNHRNVRYLKVAKHAVFAFEDNELIRIDDFGEMRATPVDCPV